MPGGLARRLRRLEEAGPPCECLAAQRRLFERIARRVNISEEAERSGEEYEPPEEEPVYCARCGREVRKVSIPFLDGVVRKADEMRGGEG